MRGVVFLHEVEDDGAGLPDGKVVVGVVDECRHAPVGIDGEVGRLLVFACGWKVWLALEKIV